MNSITQNFSPTSRFAPAKSVSVQAKNTKAPVGDGFEKSQDAEVSSKNKVKAVILTTTAVAAAAVLGAAAAVATAVVGPIVGGICGAAAIWVSRDEMLPKYAINENDGSLVRGAKKVANLAIAVGASAFMGSCAGAMSAVGIGPIVAGINGSALGLRAGTDLGERIYNNIYDNKPLAAF
jgi:hypothetical protein